MEQLIEFMENETIETLTKRGRKNELKAQCERYELSTNGSSIELANSLTKLYNVYTYKQTLEKYNYIKLPLETKSTVFQGKNVRKNVATIWRKIRISLIEKPDACCEVCGFSSFTGDGLEVHEIEKYDEENAICELVDVSLRCSKCHAFSHYMTSFRRMKPEQREALIQHYLVLNNITREQFEEYATAFITSYYAINSPWRLGIGTMPHLPQQKKVRYKIGAAVPFRNGIVKKLHEKELYVN